MVQIVTEAGHKEAKHLEVVHEPVHLPGLEHGEHGLADVQSVSPVVILDGPVILLDAQGPSADDLDKKRDLSINAQSGVQIGVSPCMGSRIY